MGFHTIISDFRERLAKQQDDTEITSAEIDDFYNKLGQFNRKKILLSKYYKKYIDNLIRLKPDLDEKNTDLTLLRVAIAENKWKPTKPFDIYFHYLKYDNAITSKPFIAYQKKHNKKKINKPSSRDETIEKLEKDGSWTRVSLANNGSEKTQHCCNGNSCKS